MKVIISYQEKAKSTLSEKNTGKQPKDISIAQETSRHLGVLCQITSPMYISYYLIPTHKNEYKPLYIHFKSLLLVRVWESYQAASLCLVGERRWGNPPHPQSLPRAAALLRELCVCAKLLQSYSTLCNPIGLQSARLLCPRDSPEEYWSGLPFSPPGDLPNPGIKPVSLTSTWTGRQILYH